MLVKKITNRACDIQAQTFYFHLVFWTNGNIMYFNWKLLLTACSNDSERKKIKCEISVVLCRTNIVSEVYSI